MCDASSSKAQTLSYATVPGEVRQLLFDETADGFMLTLPLPPTWVTWTWITMLFAVAGMELFIFGFSLYIVRKMLPGVGWQALVQGILERTVSVGFWGGWGLYALLHYRRFGRIPRSLSLSGSKLVWSRPGFWGTRYRSWDLQDVRKAELRPVKSILPGKTVMDLRIGFDRGFPLRLRIASKAPTTLDRIGRAIRELNQRGLSQVDPPRSIDHH